MPFTNPRSKFYELLQQQIENEFAAERQYIAFAVWFDSQDLPQLAKRFYRQAVEERNHALAIVRYLLDTDHPVEIPGTRSVRTEFSHPVELIELALEQEKDFRNDVEALARVARSEDDYTGEQFMQWFLKEQVEEISQMSTLLNIANRAQGNLFEIERFLDRMDVDADENSGMPPVAGGALWYGSRRS